MQEAMLSVRFATPEDAPALRAIYAQSIETPVTFEYALPSVEAFAQRIRDLSATYPYLVCQAQGRAIGYAYAHRAWAREAYQWDAELSIYLDKENTARGIGKRLYGVLIALLRLQGVRTAYGCVTLPNEKSEGLHRSLGFQPAGVFHNAGYKCGKWRDVGWYEKQIAPYDAQPRPLLPLSQAPQEAVRAALETF